MMNRIIKKWRKNWNNSRKNHLSINNIQTCSICFAFPFIALLTLCSIMMLYTSQHIFFVLVICTRVYVAHTATWKMLHLNYFYFNVFLCWGDCKHAIPIIGPLVLCIETGGMHLCWRLLLYVHALSLHWLWWWLLLFFPSFLLHSGCNEYTQSN